MPTLVKGMSITNPFTPLVNNNIVKKISSLGIFDEKKKKKELKSLGIQFISPFKVNQSIFRELPYMLFDNIVLITLLNHIRLLVSWSVGWLVA